MYIGKTFLQLVFDALRARRELDNFLNQFHYGGATKSVVDPRLGTAIAGVGKCPIVAIIDHIPNGWVMFNGDI